MAFIPPAPGRPARLPEWDGAKLSSLLDFFARWRKDLAGRLPFVFDSPDQASSIIASDGAGTPVVFGVSGDPAVWTMTTGNPVRIGPPARMSFAIVTFTWTAAGQVWSPPVDVPIDLDGKAPHFVTMQPLAESGAVFDVNPKVVYAGGYDMPDWNPTRVRVVASVTPAPSSGAVPLTRAALFMAIRQGD